MSKEIEMPSGAKLKITVSPFAISKDLYQAMMEEARFLKIDSQDELDANIFKDLFCVAFSSKKIETCIWKCMEKVTYNGLKIDGDTFELEEARGDYFTVCLEVARENVLPFTKGLYAKLSPVLEMLKALVPESKSPKTTL